METLSIIAYKQPVSKAEIEHIRGVNCDYAVMKLLEKDLIEIKGKSDAPGKPIVYATSQSFMDYFGIKAVNDLPQLKDMEGLTSRSSQGSTIGEYVEEVRVSKHRKLEIKAEATATRCVEEIQQINDA